MAHLHFSPRSRLNTVLYTRENSRGNPFAVGLATDNEGREHKVLIAGEDINLDFLPLLEGQDLALRLTENGLRARPLKEQPPGLQEHLVDALQSGAGQVARSVRIPHVNLPAPEAEDPAPPPPAGHAQHGTALPRLTELATTVAHQAAELGLPTAMWVFFPE